MSTVRNGKFDEERAFYGQNNLHVIDSSIDGPQDGESAFKECSNLTVENTFLNLRYPFWHDTGLKIVGSEMTELCRAALWYTEDVKIEDTKLHGIKAVRECADVTMVGCDIDSPEFGWFTHGFHMENSTAVSEYFLMHSSDVSLDGVHFTGKYSFQYVDGGELSDCTLDTKDAFWHTRGVTVRDSVIKGEYLGWYSEGLTLINCRIEGTQPFCYCKNLTLINCEMIDTDLAFEKSEVMATVTTPILSVKNPASGIVAAPAVGELIMDDPAAQGQVVIGASA